MYIGANLDDGRHVALTYNGRNATKNEYKRSVIALAKAADNVPEPIVLEFGELVRFDGSGVWVVLVNSDSLRNFRARLVTQLHKEEIFVAEDYPYTPHITLSRGKKLVRENPYLGLTYELDRISLCSDDFGTTDILL